MKIKIECACQTRFEFEVEPVGGKMPCAVACPQCGADATQAANEAILAQVQSEPVPISPPASNPAISPAGPVYCPKHPEELAIEECRVCGRPICGECLRLFGYVCSVYCRSQAKARGIALPTYAQQKEVVAGQRRRKARWLAVAALVCVGALLGAWAWYALVGSKPRVVWSLPLAREEAGAWCELLPNEQVLVVTPKNASLQDLRQGRALWTVPLSGAVTASRGKAGPASDIEERRAAEPDVRLIGNELWVVLSDRLARIDRRSGQRGADIPLPTPIRRVEAGQEAMLIVSGEPFGKTTLSRVDLATGHVLTESLPVEPRPQNRDVFDLLLQADPFALAGPNIVELRTRLLEKRVLTREAIRSQGPSAFESGRISGANRDQIANEIATDMNRDATGGLEHEDASRYQVTLKRRLPSGAPDWSGEVTGQPWLFASRSVDLLVAGRSLVVLDKNNRKRWEAKLTYPIAEWFDPEEGGEGLPCLETGSGLYFFDQGMLTAFDLATGAVRWRLTTVGIAGVQADARGGLYVMSSSANPETLRFSQQVDLGKKIKPVLMKVDAATGKVLWQVEDIATECQPVARFVYTSRAQYSPSQVIGAGGDLSEVPVHHRIHCLDTETGEVRWVYYRQKAPGLMRTLGNEVLLRYSNEIKVLRFLAF